MISVGILLCDDHYEDTISVYGHYDDAFKRLLSIDGINVSKTFRCFQGEFPSQPDACDVWVITGSKWSVYDNDPWIETLATFIRLCDKRHHPLLGVCFGHQIIHFALGGTVEKSDKGWGMGLYPLNVTHQGRRYFTADTPSSISLLAVHQDQVHLPADTFMTIASSDFCPQAITVKETHILTMQCHPEFTAPFIIQLLERLREKAGDENVDRARRTVEWFGEGERQYVVSLLRRFILSCS
ncbi:type 1 glutamine amidotransferase [Enterovibrio nigricans]|uniref:GMP synthase-Glutamine amidotransferase n=1 Tax=Enterovibrio nigricans DSM 22720 TaxID=1121868 RepID=A0A1T4UYE0_9GAMM|nr:type 1 glutamine amidotransferase [Enterovibrio nigricans]SKA57646.1 GMP synthase-Glutamine amidotransferase [Enterovibrio nigricans DSM 22720]